MLLIQLTGLSGSGKSTIANGTKMMLLNKGLPVEVIDGDMYRKKLYPELGFSREERCENIRRLGWLASRFVSQGVISLLAAINPFEEVRRELTAYGPHVKTVWIRCELDTLLKRDTKQLYRRAFLPEGHPDKISNLTGINDPYEFPEKADLIVDTTFEAEKISIEKLVHFILNSLGRAR